MKNLKNVSLMRVNDDKEKTYKGYYSEEIIDKKIKSENFKALNLCSGDTIVKNLMDFSKFIVRVLPKINNSKDRLIIEKYLQGFTLEEIGLIVGLKHQNVSYRIKKYMDLIKENLSDEYALCELYNGGPIEEIGFENKKIKVEKNVAKARMILENEFGYETFIYPFDIGYNSYKITIKHTKLPTEKLSQNSLIEKVKKLKNIVDF